MDMGIPLDHMRFWLLSSIVQRMSPTRDGS